MKVTAKTLISDFNYFRVRTRRYRYLSRKQPIKNTKANTKLFNEMIAWCTERGFNPRMWLYSLFVLRRWVFPPKCSPVDLMSNHNIEKFKALDDYRIYRKMIESELATKREKNIDDPNEYDPNRDLSHASEGLKHAFVRENNTKGCIDRMDRDTFGYHPRSVVCGKCPSAVSCASILIGKYPFDIIALRKGEITSSACRAIAQACRKSA